MDKHLYMFLMILAMAGVTYLIRLLPMIVFKKKIKSQFINSLLYYIPYAVLSAMTFPFILYSSGHLLSAIVGTTVSVIASFCKRSMITVALLSSATVLVCDLLILFIF